MIEFEDQIGLTKARDVSGSIGGQRGDEDAFLYVGKRRRKCNHSVCCVGPTPMPPSEPVFAANPTAVIFWRLLIFIAWGRFLGTKTGGGCKQDKERQTDNFVGVHIGSLFDCEAQQEWSGFGSG